jgi:hypothetical protein
MRRRAVLVAVVAGALLAAPVPALGQVAPGSTTDAAVKLAPNPVRVLGALTIDAGGFKPDSLVAVDVVGIARLDRLHAGPDGNLHLVATLPATVTAGQHEVSLIGVDPEDAPRMLNGPFEVVEGFGNTGAPPLVWTTIALALIALGQALVHSEQRLRWSRVRTAPTIVLRLRHAPRAPRVRLQPRAGDRHPPRPAPVRLRRRSVDRDVH